jgi:hypothetical protein
MLNMGYATERILELGRRAQSGEMNDAEIVAASEHADPIVRYFLARREGLPAELIEKLAADEHPDVRLSVATRLSAEDETLALKLAGDPVENVRQTLVRAIGQKAGPLSRELAEKLSNDPDHLTRFLLANGETALPEDILRKLAADADPGVRAAIAERKEIPDDVLEAALLDPSSNVRWHAVNERILEGETAERLARDDDACVRMHVAGKSRLSAKTVDALSRDEASMVRRITLERDDVTDEIIARLAEDPDINVRATVSRHPRAKLATLVLLSLDKTKTVSRKARGRLERLKPTAHERIELSSELEERHPKRAKSIKAAMDRIFPR